LPRNSATAIAALHVALNFKVFTLKSQVLKFF